VGTPVIAYGKGGALETVQGYSDAMPRTGIFFESQTIQSIRDAVDSFEKNASDFSFRNCRLNAERFSKQHFLENMKLQIEAALLHHREA